MKAWLKKHMPDAHVVIWRDMGNGDHIVRIDVVDNYADAERVVIKLLVTDLRLSGYDSLADEIEQLLSPDAAQSRRSLLDDPKISYACEGLSITYEIISLQGQMVLDHTDSRGANCHDVDDDLHS